MGKWSQYRKRGRSTGAADLPPEPDDWTLTLESDVPAAFMPFITRGYSYYQARYHYSNPAWIELPYSIYGDYVYIPVDELDYVYCQIRFTDEFGVPTSEWSAQKLIEVV